MTIPTRSVSPLPPGTALARYAKALKFGAEFAAQFPDTPQVRAALDLRQKEMVAGMSTGNAPDLVSVGIWDTGTAQLLAAVDVLEAAAPRMRAVPFQTLVPRELTTGTTGGWIDESSAKLVVSYAFDSLTLAPSLIGGIVVVTDELLRDRRTDPLLRNLILNTIGRTSTAMFLDPSMTGTAAHPGSITSTGAVAVTATGNVADDLGTMLAAITTSGAGLAWMLSPLDLAYIASSVHAPDVPRTLLGLPVILAPHAPRHQVTLADLAEIAYALLPITIDVSRQTSIEMDDAPTMNSGGNGSPAGAIGTTVVSLFQTNSAAFRLTRFANWSVVRETAVSFCVLNVGSPA